MNLSNNTILIIAGLFLWQVIGLASVTALAANHRWGVWVCVGLPYIGIDFCKDELIEIFNNFAMRLLDTRFLPNFLLVITKVQLFKGNIDSDTFRYIHIKYIRDCELSLVISDDDFEDKGHEIVTEFLNELNIN